MRGQLANRETVLMRFTSKLALAIAVFAGSTAAARAQSEIPVKIGVLTDMSSLYSDIGGAGSVAAATLCNVFDLGGSRTMAAALRLFQRFLL